MIEDRIQFAKTPIEEFRQGWALMPFRGERAHHWTRIEWMGRTTLAPDGKSEDPRYGYRSLCGLVVTTTHRAPPLDDGNWPRCKRCQKSASTGAPDGA